MPARCGPTSSGMPEPPEPVATGQEQKSRHSIQHEELLFLGTHPGKPSRTDAFFLKIHCTGSAFAGYVDVDLKAPEAAAGQRFPSRERPATLLRRRNGAIECRVRALAENRTPDLILTMDALCRLSYQGVAGEA